jgi:hypothetical protein
MEKVRVEYSLAHPVFDPDLQINSSFGWFEERDVSIMLTCNIGME